jgi:transcriptional regulator with XRE-family HTH domain
MVSEFQKAKAWREKHDWSVKDLSNRTGFSIEAIYRFERGTVVREGKNRKIAEEAWQRFRTACAGAELEAIRGRKFNW